MSRSVIPRPSDVLAVMRHLADVAALKGDPPAQRQLLIDGLNALVGADTSFFYVADDWRAGRRPRFSHYTLSTQAEPAFVRYAAEFGMRFSLDDDPFCYASLRDDEPLRAWTKDEVLVDEAGHPAPGRFRNYLDLAAATGYRDGTIAYYRSGARGDRLVGVGMHRFGPGQPPLSARQVALARFAVGEVRRLVERGHLALPPTDSDGGTSLSPRLQQVLDRLLGGQAPKAIARELGLSLWTVREYIQRIYQHINVSGREELMARFVGTAGGAGDLI